MNTALDCLRHVIGLSVNPCPCYDEGRNAEYGVSLSGYYLDGMDYGLPLSYPQKVHDCEHGNLWELAYQAREQGVAQFITEFGAAVRSSKWVKMQPAWAGSIGNQKKGALVGTQPIHGVVLEPDLYRGVTLQISEIRVTGDAPDTTVCDVDIYRESELLGNNSTPLATLSGTFINGLCILKPAGGQPLHIPLMDSAGQCDPVYVVSTKGGFQPYNTAPRTQSKGCGSCGGRRRTQVQHGWERWVTASGVQVAADQNDLPNATRVNNTTYGIFIEAATTCVSTWWCQPIDWANDDWARTAAELMLLYSNRMLIGYILRSDMANIYTAARSEELIAKRDYINQLIMERMPWLVESLPQGYTDCYYCRGTVRKRSLLV